MKNMKYLNINVEFNKPEKEIEGIVTKCGGQSPRCSSTYSGAKVDFRIDDKLDEKVFKKNVIDELKKKGFKAH